MRKILLVLLLLFANGCISIGLYENPEITRKGTVSTTFGSTVFFVSSDHFALVPIPDIHFNMGVLDNMEVSFRYPLYIRNTTEGKTHYLTVLGGKIRAYTTPGLIFSLGMDIFENSEKEFNPIKVFYPGIAFTDRSRKYLFGVYYTIFSPNRVLKSDSSWFQIEFSNFLRFYGSQRIRLHRDIDAILGGQLILPISKDGSPFVLFEIGFTKNIY